MKHTHLPDKEQILTELKPVLDIVRKYSTIEEFIEMYRENQRLQPLDESIFFS